MTSASFKSSVFALGFACLGVAPAYAAPAPTFSFHPVKSWVAQDMDAADGKFCTLRNEYNNGFVLQFASAGTGLEMLAVNFRQDIFEVGHDYNVSVSIPGGSSRNTVAKASKPDQLKMGLRGQDDFFANLKKADAFDLKIEDNSFRFEMAGFGAAAPALEKCMAPAAAKSAPVPLNAPPAMAAARSANAATPPARPQAAPSEAIMPVPLIPAAGAQKAPAKMASEDIPPPVPLAAKKPDAEKPADKKPAETITWNVAPPVKSAPMPLAPPAQKTPDATPQKPVETAALPKPVESAPTAPPVVKTENFRTPEYKVKKERETMSADFTRLESEFQRGGEGPVSARKPDRAVSQNEKIDMPESSSRSDDERVDAAIPEDQPFARKNKRIQTDTALDENVRNKVEITSVPAMRAPVEPDSMPSGQRKIAAMAAPDHVITRPDPEMAMKVSDLEQQVQKLKAEKDNLNRDLKTNLAAGEEERTSIASGNWDLERATMRYNEADREIKRLGQKIQQERAQCEVEKKDLEAMLFDPRVTEQKQMAKLADLEEKLSAAQTELSDQRMRYETRIKELEKR